MKKFTFRLQKVLALREAREKLRLGEFGREQQKLQDEQARLELFQTEREMQIRDTRSVREQPFSAWSQGISTRYMQRIGRVVDFQQTRVQTQEQALEQARHRYTEARRDTRILEMLREKKVDEWTRENLLDEAKVLDEVGSRNSQPEETCQ
ncbi:MAG TPA: flagellar export protein FliJ [bacterium]|jgi:flagellar FliJ protein